MNFPIYELLKLIFFSYFFIFIKNISTLPIFFEYLFAFYGVYLFHKGFLYHINSRICFSFEWTVSGFSSDCERKTIQICASVEFNNHCCVMYKLKLKTTLF